jgi:hypothetical protein
MVRTAKDGRHLADLVLMAIPLCKAAQARCFRRGPGRPPDYEEWQIALLILVAIVHRRKSKSSQWRFIIQHQYQLLELLRLRRLPTRSTYFHRYQQAWRLYAKAIELQGKKALQEHVSSARVIAADKSLIPARGPQWHVWQQRNGERRPGTDTAAGWGRSIHDGWLWSYGYEVVVCFASCGSCSSGRSFAYSFFQTPPRGGSPCCSARGSRHKGPRRTFTSKSSGHARHTKKRTALAGGPFTTPNQSRYH